MAFPVACMILSKIICTKTLNENIVHIRIYVLASETTFESDVNQDKKTLENSKPKIKKTSPFTNPNKIPCIIVLFA